MAEKVNVGPDIENLLNFQPLNMDSDWRLGGNNMTESSMKLISAGNSVAVCQGNILESSSCSSATMVDPLMWDQPSNSQTLGVSEVDVHHDGISQNALGFRPSGLGPSRDGFGSIIGLDWGLLNDIFKGGMFVPGAARLLPQRLPHFPADSGFIERAAKYSCFSGGNFGEILNPFCPTETLNPEPRVLAPTQRSQEAFGQSGLKPVFGATVQKNVVNMAESSEQIHFPADPGLLGECPLKDEKINDVLGRSNNEAKLGVSDPSDDSEFSGQGDQGKLEGAFGDSSMGVGLKKRKRSGQVKDSEQDRGMRSPEHQTGAAKDQTVLKQKGKQNPSSIHNKSGGKNGKQGPQASDSPKEEYIHVRARRGQATNSHSLAERVRREKISERMKLLQDLVPGCSKVTGKAVMLDEIINYVQSLQRQVEFLSMKLAIVNPQIDGNVERLLAKDIVHSRAGPSSSLAFPTDMQMGYAPLHQSQGLAQTGIQGLGNPADLLRRSMNSSLTAIGGGYRETQSHVRTWEDGLHNAIQTGLISKRFAQQP